MGVGGGGGVRAMSDMPERVWKSAGMLYGKRRKPCQNR